MTKPPLAEQFTPVLLLTSDPPGVFQYGIEQALKARGVSVVTAGPKQLTPATEPLQSAITAALQRHHPGYGLDIVCSVDEPLEAIIARCEAAPQWVLYFESPWGFLPRGLEGAKVPTVALMTEDYVHADWSSRLYPLFDLVLLTWRRTVALYRDRGHDNVAQWYFGARGPFHRDLGVERIYDVAFIGNLDPHVQRERNRVVERIMRLRRQGLRCVVVNGVFFEDYNSLHAQTHIVYHHSITRQINMRVFEAMAAGCLVICHRPEDQEDPTSHIFTHGADIVFVDSEDEVPELIRYYLEHGDERERIARAGRDKVVAYHNYENVLDDLFDLLPDHLGGDVLARRRDRLSRWGYGPEEIRYVYGYYYTYNQAPAIGKTQLKEEGESPRLLNALGVAALVGGDFPEAVASFEAALAERPAFALALCNLATSHMSERQGLSSADEARRQTEKALRVLAEAEFSEDDLEGPYLPIAYERFRLEMSKAYVDYPAGPERRLAISACLTYQMFKYLALLAAERGDWDEVERDALEALAIVDDDGYVLSGMAQIYCERKRFGDAVAVLQKAMELEPFHSEAQWNLSRLYRFLGQSEQAIRQLVDSIELNPLFGPYQVPGLNELGKWLKEAGHTDDAHRCWQESLRLNPHQPQIQALVEPPTRSGNSHALL